MSKKILVAYFSASGITAKTAKVIADTVHADLFEIKPAEPYTADDLNWMDKNSRSSREMSNPSFRPALLETCDHIGDYDLVLLGFPIWWYVAPTIIHTFLENHDFSGKKIVLFATSGGSGFGNTVQTLRRSVADTAVITEGKVWSGKIDPASVAEWAENWK